MRQSADYHIPYELVWMIKSFVITPIHNNETIRKAVGLWKNDKERALREYGHISGSNTSSITDMAQLFAYYSLFRLQWNIDHWDVSKVTNMRGMFGSIKYGGAEFFNQPLDKWVVRNVKIWLSYLLVRSNLINLYIVRQDTNMERMFLNARSFNQPLNQWNVGNVTNMSSLFATAIHFNQPLNDWDVSNVLTKEKMFYNASSFNHPLARWDVRNVVNMSSMFKYAKLFHQSLRSWSSLNGFEPSTLGILDYASSFDDKVNVRNEG